MNEFQALDFMVCADSSNFVREEPFIVAVLDYALGGAPGLTPELIKRYGALVLNIDVDEDYMMPETRLRLKDVREALSSFFKHTQLFENEYYAQLYAYAGDVESGINELVRQKIINADQAEMLVAYTESDPVRPHRGAQIRAQAPEGQRG